MSKTLYRPVGLKELQLIIDFNFLKFPPRLPEQPFFYPVCSLEYAEKIARDWNTKDKQSSYLGAVTRFDIYDGIADRYPEHQVGGNTHRELWIPSNELECFNRYLINGIKVLKIYINSKFPVNELDNIITISKCNNIIKDM
jgi:hypothetical protein